MSKMRITFISLGIGVSVSATALAAEVMLNVRTGLWQVSTTQQMSGLPPLPTDELAKLTPEQRAKMEAGRQALTAQLAKPHTFSECISDEQLRRGFKTDTKDDRNCKDTVTSNTGSVLQVQMECGGTDQKMSGTIRFQALSPVAVTGSSDFVISGARTMTAKSTIQGKWLGSDCGTLKPGETK